MELKEAYETYAIRLYEWSLMEFVHEIEFDFPILRMVQNRSVQALIVLMEQLTEDEKQKLAVTLVKNAHSHTLRRQGIQLTDEDHLQFGEYHLKSAQYRSLLPSKINSTPQGDSSKLTPKRASQAILRSWSNVLQAEAIPTGKREWMFVNQINQDWAVKTSIGIYSGGNTGGVIVNFRHIADRCDYVSSYEKPPGMPNYLSTLGVAQSWDILYQDELELAEKSLLLACSRFMEHLPGLLIGLTREAGN